MRREPPFTLASAVWKCSTVGPLSPQVAAGRPCRELSRAIVLFLTPPASVGEGQLAVLHSCGWSIWKTWHGIRRRTMGWRFRRTSAALQRGSWIGTLGVSELQHVRSTRYPASPVAPGRRILRHSKTRRWSIFGRSRSRAADVMPLRTIQSAEALVLLLAPSLLT
ncbi:hypothetical protein EV126DRAFT_228046 [Verticillium dahliae]|nr:hypothetical protein EV126DRAFT_228046 [Verticillium dahliae]